MGYSNDVYPRQVCASTTNTLHSNLATATTTSATYVCLKEITITYAVRPHGSLRVVYDMNCLNAFTDAKTNVYRNGVAIGTERTNTQTTVLFDTFTEDFVFTDLAFGDKIQIYAKDTGGHTAEVKNFYIFGVLSFMNSSVE